MNILFTLSLAFCGVVVALLVITELSQDDEN